MSKSETKTITISLTCELLEAVDRTAKPFYTTRTAYIRHALIEQMQVDNDPDYRRWQTQKRTPTWATKAVPSEGDFDLYEDYV